MDILSPALSLEDTYYAEGLALGQADGAKAGLVEGRRFGLEKGFEKFALMGQLHGRSIVWNNRTQTTTSSLPEPKKNVASDAENVPEVRFLPQVFEADEVSNNVGVAKELLPPNGAGGGRISLPAFPQGQSLARLDKHVVTLYALTELESLSVENTEEAVADFDDRYRRAVAKASIVGRLVGEHVGIGGARPQSHAGRDGMVGEGEMEDISGTRIDRRKEAGHDVGDLNDLEMEIR